MVSLPALLPAKLPSFIPAPAIASAAGNVAHKVLYGGLADIRPMPRTLIDEGVLREVYRYRPAKDVPQQGDPILLVMPLAAPSSCYDLRRGCSLVEHLVAEGRPTYLVEYGEVSFANRSLGVEHWVEEVLPAAIRVVSEDAGGRPVHVVAWSLGGIFALLSAAAHPELPIATLGIFGSPVDVSQVPLIAPLRPIVQFTDGRIIGGAVRILGGAPKPLVRWAFQVTAAQKMVTKPMAQLTHLADTDFLAQLEAVDRFTKGIIAYPGRTFGQLYHRFLARNELSDGTFDVEGREVRLADITVPVIVFGGATDGIAPSDSVRPLVDLLSSAAEVRFHEVPGGHLGMLTGRAARTTSWPLLDAWMRRHDAVPGQVLGEVVGDASAARPAQKKPAIGANPTRRFSSQSSRDLRR
ncbi:MAG: alpha/beta fold hydrolase [Nocardioides sp.]